MKQAIFIIILILLAGAWYFKVTDVMETSDRNDRVAVNNQIVSVINELQTKVREPQLLLEQFIDLSKLTESQQRGTWELLELIDINFEEEISAAREQMADIDTGDNQQLSELKAKGLTLLESYNAFTPAYQRMVDQIKSKQLNSAEIEALIASEMNKITLATTTASDAFMLAQESFLRGD